MFKIIQQHPCCLERYDAICRQSPIPSNQSKPASPCIYTWCAQETWILGWVPRTRAVQRMPSTPRTTIPPPILLNLASCCQYFREEKPTPVAVVLSRNRRLSPMLSISTTVSWRCLRPAVRWEVRNRRKQTSIPRIQQLDTWHLSASSRTSEDVGVQ